MNKDGYVGDILMWGIMILTIMIIAALGFLILSSASDSVPTDQSVMKSSLELDTVGWGASWDFAIVSGFGFMLLASLTLAWMVGTDSSFFWITLIILIFMILALVVINNIAVAFFDNVVFTEAMEEMPGTAFIIDNLFFLCVGGAGLLLTVLFARNRQEV